MPFRRESFNIVVVFTDGKATDGQCQKQRYTCDAHKACASCWESCKLNGSRDPDQAFCTLHYEAPRLKALSDRNQTVTVVSVGFGQVDRQELEYIASSDENVIIAEGRDASTGFAKLETLLDQLVEKVCLRLPEDCVLEHTPWSECCGGAQYKFRRVKRVLREARNGGKACPSGKQLFIKEYVECPQTQPECGIDTTASATTTTTVATTTRKPTTTTATTTATTAGTFNLFLCEQE